MDNKPLVSVCIPTYNGANTVKETIDSVLSQTITDFEIILCDDNSADDTCKIAESIKDKRINIVRNETNLGAVGNCNRALTYARGEYIKVLMQDDILDPTHLEKCIDFLKSDNNIIMTTCSANIIDENGSVTMVRRHFKKDGIFDGDSYARRSLRGRNIFGEPSIVLFRRSVYDKGLRFDPSLPFDFDWDFAIGAVSGKKIAYIAEPLAAFRLSTTSISGNTYREKKRTVCAETAALFDKHARRLHMNKIDRIIINLNTRFLLFAKMIFTMLTVKRK